jgi:hypothetical protein
MAKGGDWIPSGQEDFVAFSNQYVSGIEENMALLNLATATVTPFKTGQTTFNEEWAVLEAEGESHVNTVAKRELVAARRTVLRSFHNKNVRYNDGLTDTIRARCGIPIPDQTDSPIGPSQSRPILAALPYDVRRLKITRTDEQTGQRKRPYGQSGMLLLSKVGGPKPSGIAGLDQSVLVTALVHILEFLEEQRGEPVHLAACWQTETGVRGPFSEIITAIIP